MTYLEMQENEANKTRETARDIFVASLRDYAARIGWAKVLIHLSFAYHCGMAPAHDRSVEAIAQDEMDRFALDYGWPDTLRAIAQAMHGDEQFKREAEARR